jgi:hypothetical protein
MARSIPTDQQLLNKRADVNATADSGASALGNAVARADAGLVRALLAARAEVAAGAAGGSAVDMAGRVGNAQIVQLLSEAARGPHTDPQPASSSSSSPSPSPGAGVACLSLATTGTCSTPRCPAVHDLCDTHMSRFGSCLSRACARVHPDRSVYSRFVTCSICMDLCGAFTAQLPCGHVFDYQCLSSWLSGGNTTCPNCRARIR